MVNRSRTTGRNISTFGVATSRDNSQEARIGRQIIPQANGCWLWKGRRATYGGTSSTAIGSICVHRYVYEMLVGPIEAGHHLHHKCEMPGCCNPDHLVSLTPKEHAAAHRALRTAS